MFNFIIHRTSAVWHQKGKRKSLLDYLMKKDIFRHLTIVKELILGK